MAGRELPAAVPIKPDLGVLGHKWALIILTDVGLRGVDRFSEILRTNPSLSPRILSLRLRELEEAGMITRVDTARPPRPVRWATTEKGQDILPAIVRLIAFGARWNAENPFRGRPPKRMART
jgi:DNA-binding HxlR family transcriptional regulator